MLRKQLQNLLPHIGMIALLLLYCNIYYGDTIQKLPFGIHSWAQADRLALAFGFYDHGMNFLLPSTFNLGSVDGITGVEFPLQSYLAAMLGLVFGRNSIPLLFRLLDISIAVTGLYFLFRTVFLVTKDFMLSIFTPLFIFCSPVYVFYSGNFLPDPAAASVVFVSFYFLINYLQQDRLKLLVISICIATLATLLKSSSVIYLGSILFCGLYRSVILQKNRKAFIVVMVCSVVAGLTLALNIHHINSVNNTYKGSIFLASLRPFENPAALISFLENGFKNGWINDYFIIAEYPMLFFIVFFGMTLKAQPGNTKRLNIPLAVMGLFCLVIFYLFGAQFPVHDYYFIAIFIPLIAYLMVVSFIRIGQAIPREFIRPFRIGLLGALLIILFMADHQLYLRMHLLERYQDSTEWWFNGGADYLAELKVPKEQHIMVADENSPNLSLLYFDRRGYTLCEDCWGKDLRNAYNQLQERQLKTLMLNAETFHRLSEQDSFAYQVFNVHLKDRMAVLIKK